MFHLDRFIGVGKVSEPAWRRKASIHQREKPSLLLMKTKYNELLVSCDHRQMTKRRPEWAQQEVVRVKYLTTKKQSKQKENALGCILVTS